MSERPLQVRRAGSEPLDPKMFDEVSSALAWDDDLSGEALIIGELSESTSRTEAAPVSYESSGPSDEGATVQLLLYADDRSVRQVNPEAKPWLVTTPEEGSLTPYEGYLVTHVDGERSIEELMNAGLLAPTEITAAILALVDRGVLSLAPRPEAEAEPVPLEPSALSPLEPELSPPVPAVARVPPPLPVRTGLPAAVQRNVRETSRVAPPPIVALPPTPEAPVAEAPVAEAPVTEAPATEALVVEAPAVEVRVAPRVPTRPLSEQESKAAKLYEAALADQDAGKHVSALMNIKLAIAFDSKNQKYHSLFKRLSLEPTRRPGTAPRISTEAQALFAEGCEAEANGDVDRAIRTFSAALQRGKDPAIMNRLGVILATRKGSFNKAQRLLQQAVDLEPKNQAYLHNLEKVLSAAALEAGEGPPPPPPSPGLAGKVARYWDRFRK